MKSLAIEHRIHAGPLTPVIIVHGTGGTGQCESDACLEIARKTLKFNALLIYPQFEFLFQFLGLNQDQKLIEELRRLAGEHTLSDGWLVHGFSGGAQFSHRFAYRWPHLIRACAPLGAGGWTSPNGEFFGMMQDQGWLKPRAIRPEWDHPDVHANAIRPAADGYQRIHWLIGCGRQDLTRYPSAQRYHQILQRNCKVEPFLDWDAAHTMTPESYQAVFEFFNRAV